MAGKAFKVTKVWNSEVMSQLQMSQLINEQIGTDGLSAKERAACMLEMAKMTNEKMTQHRSQITSMVMGAVHGTL